MHLDARRFGLILSASLMVSCGARTGLLSGSDGDDDGGGEAGSDASMPNEDASTDAPLSSDVAIDTITDVGASEAQPACTIEDPATWEMEHYRDDGDYERAVAATSGVPWVAFKVKNGNIKLDRLGVDDAGIAVEDSFEIPNSPVYPVAFDVSDEYFVLLTTTGINWNGDVEVWSVNRSVGTVVRRPVGQPPADPAHTMSSAIGFVGSDVVLSYGRLIDDLGTLEIRDAALDVKSSLSLEDARFRAVRRTPLLLDIYVGGTTVFHIGPGGVTSEPADPDWPLLGGLHEYLVQYDSGIRIIRGDDAWYGPWPHSQISPPAVVREHGQQAVFSLATELTGVVGYPRGGALQWLEIEPAAGASGVGVALMPLIADGRMGLFYLGLEIPHPEQPLRYFGRVCR